jgi:hypothetical protein
MSDEGNFVQAFPPSSGGFTATRKGCGWKIWQYLLEDQSHPMRLFNISLIS